MKTHGIYAIRNTVSGRVYVGSSQDIHGRWAVHRHALRQGTHHARMLQRSWEKHGAGVFVFEVLEVVKIVADLLPREQHWIDSLGAYDWTRGLNGRQNASSPRGHKFSPEIRTAMSEARIGRKKTPEHAAKLALARNEGLKRWIEKRRSDPAAALAYSEKLSALRKGRYFSPEHRANIGKAHRGKIVSLETRAKQSKAQKERFRRDKSHPLKLISPS